MNKYFIQVKIYTRYFFRVAYDNKIVFIYSAFFPIVMLIIQARQLMFQPISTLDFNRYVLPWISWLIFSDIIFSVMDIAVLREQGYFKQYYSLVTNKSVFIVSKIIVNLVILSLTMLATSIVCSLLFQMGLAVILLKLMELILISFIPLVSICLPLIAMPIKQKTIPVLVNLIMVLLLVISTLLITLYNLKVTNIFMNIIDPVFFISDVFAFLTHTIGYAPFLLTYTIVFVITILIGLFSYKKMLILPVER